MNKKLYFSTVFITLGTVIALTAVIVVAVNFVRDSRVLNSSKSISTSSQAASTKLSADSSASNDGSDDSTDAAKPSKPSTAAASTVDKNQKIKVEIINYTGISRLAEDIRTTLEAAGYEVSAGNDKSNKPVQTTIIEWNDKKAGTAIQKLLNAGRIVHSPDAGSRFDVTIKLGDDYQP